MQVTAIFKIRLSNICTYIVLLNTWFTRMEPRHRGLFRSCRGLSFRFKWCLRSPGGSMERSTGLRGSTATFITCEKVVVLWGSCVWGSGFWRRVTRVSGLQSRKTELWRFGVKFRVAVFKVTACKQVCSMKGICIISWRCDRLGLWCTETLFLSLRGRDEISRSWERVIFPGFLSSSNANWSLESFHWRWRTFSANDLTTANLGLLQLLM